MNELFPGLALALLGLSTCGGHERAERPSKSASEAVYDTIADVGGADETNPLLVYRLPAYPQLIGETTVLYADVQGGRLTAVDLLSGKGWEVLDQGGEGPGEFGGLAPWFSESDGFIYTASQRGQAAKHSLDGELLTAVAYREFIHDGEVIPFPVGILDSGILVVYFQERPRPSSGDVVEVQQGFRAYSPKLGLLWSYTAFPRVVRRWELRPDGSHGSVELGGSGFLGDARHGTVAIVRNGEPWLLLMNADGSRRAHVTLDYDANRVFIDGNERIWVEVWKNRSQVGKYLVFDRNGNDVTRVDGRNVQDARGDHLLTIRSDELGAVHMYLLRRRR